MSEAALNEIITADVAEASTVTASLILKVVKLKCIFCKENTSS